MRVPKNLPRRVAHSPSHQAAALEGAGAPAAHLQLLEVELILLGLSLHGLGHGTLTVEQRQRLLRVSLCALALFTLLPHLLDLPLYGGGAEPGVSCDSTLMLQVDPLLGDGLGIGLWHCVAWLVHAWGACRVWDGCVRELGGLPGKPASRTTVVRRAAHLALKRALMLSPGAEVPHALALLQLVLHLLVPDEPVQQDGRHCTTHGCIMDASMLTVGCALYVSWGLAGAPADS